MASRACALLCSDAQTDCVIVGAGIAGVTTARAMAEAGRLWLDWAGLGLISGLAQKALMLSEDFRLMALRRFGAQSWGCFCRAEFVKYFVSGSAARFRDLLVFDKYDAIGGCARPLASLACIIVIIIRRRLLTIVISIIISFADRESKPKSPGFGRTTPTSSRG